MSLQAQTARVRGYVYEKESGEPVPYANVYIDGTTTGVFTDIDGFYTIDKLNAGTFFLRAESIGFDSVKVEVTLADGETKNLQLYLLESGIEIQEISVSARKENARRETNVSVARVTPKQIQALPSTGGDADIAQFLTVLPGVVSSGDQGGQIYIRGGSPVQTKILMDGMNIYRPFHSIGMFSVFETEALRSMDVYSAGFNAEYGTRTSAIIDIKTREGNKTRFGGLVSASPFQAKALLEGPIKKFEEGDAGSISFILTAKHSYLNETSKTLYKYATDDEYGLPYEYTDLYGKVSFLSDNGTSINLFGFNFNDKVNYPDVANLDWKSGGGGMDFRVVPRNSNMLFGGHITYSQYQSDLVDQSGLPRSNKLSDFNLNLNFAFLGRNTELRYGLDINGFETDYKFTNGFGYSFDEVVNNTDIGAFFKYKQIFNEKFILEPGIRLQYYAGQSVFSFEPRLSMKYNATDNLRFKFAGGYYSQNILSTVSDRDIVNLFVGFLSTPSSSIVKSGPDMEEVDDPLLRSRHLVLGVEIDATDQLTFNVEPYWKEFNQLVVLNRGKEQLSDPDYLAETGSSFGVDVTMDYRPVNNLNVWFTYSYGDAKRDNGYQEYPAVFDRRHNVNFLTSWAFGGDRSWELSLRWNMGSGFPFTQVEGFYGFYNFNNSEQTDIVTGNPNLTPAFSDVINGGRLPYYHRLDLGLKKTFEFGKYSKLELNASVTNLYDRENIFYVDLLTLDRVNQLPILPAMGIKFSF